MKIWTVTTIEQEIMDGTIDTASYLTRWFTDEDEAREWFAKKMKKCSLRHKLSRGNSRGGWFEAYEGTSSELYVLQSVDLVLQQ